MNWFKKYAPFLIGIICFIVYFITASRYIPWGDGAEFYLAVKTMGIPHPSGYPLFILVGRLFYLLFQSPFGLNLLAGIFTALTAFFIFSIIREFTKDSIIAASLVMFFAFGFEVWQQSIVAEIYTLNLLLFSAIFYFTIRSRDNMRYIPLVFVFSGLALTNHLTALFYTIPVLTYLVLCKPGDFRNLRYIIWTILPLAMYAYFPIRSRANPILDHFNPETMGALMNFILGRAFHYRTLFLSNDYLFKSFFDFVKSWWHQFLILIPLGFYGIFLIIDKKIRYLLLVILVLVLGYTLLYNIPDKQGYYLPVYAVWLIFTGLALTRLVPKRFRTLLFIFPVAALFLNFRVCNYSKEASLHDLCAAIYKDLPAHSVIFSDDYFVYCGLLDQEMSARKNVVIISQFYLKMDWYIEQLRREPFITVSEEINDMIESCKRELANTTKQKHGEINKRYCHLIQRALIQANISKTNIYFFIYDDASWPTQWFEFFLKYHGLYYQFQEDSLAPDIYPLDLPAPAEYQMDRQINDDAKAVTRKFAAAYNRRGINHFRLGNRENALDDFHKALIYYPDYNQVYSNLGLVYYSMADTTRALAAWQTFLDNAEPGPARDHVKHWYDQLKP